MVILPTNYHFRLGNSPPISRSALLYRSKSMFTYIVFRSMSPFSCPVQNNTQKAMQPQRTHSTIPCQLWNIGGGPMDLPRTQNQPPNHVITLRSETVQAQRQYRLTYLGTQQQNTYFTRSRGYKPHSLCTDPKSSQSQIELANPAVLDIHVTSPKSKKPNRYTRAYKILIPQVPIFLSTELEQVDVARIHHVRTSMPMLY